jgi:uncharacterized phage infection (PIP) family protein YhgE
MNSPKATTILNEILQKLSSIAEPEKVVEETTELEAVTEETPIEEVEAAAEVEESVLEATEELSEEAELETEETQLMEGYVTEEAFASKIAEMEAKMAEMAKMLDSEMGYKRELEELSSKMEKLSAEPAAEAINHNPEAATEKKPIYNFGMQRSQNTLDRVFNRLNNQN